MRYLTDGKRHLICDPYSIPNLHAMAADLNIGRHWFHRKARDFPGMAAQVSHYDVPKRRQAEIEARCVMVTTRQLIAIAGEAIERERR